MEIKKTIELNLEQKDDNFICYDLTTLKLILGTTSVIGNYSIYNIKTLKNPIRYQVSIDEVKKRINLLKMRKINLQNKIEIMEQLM